VFLDTAGEDEPDWDAIATIVEDAFRYVAPKRLITELDHGRPPAAGAPRDGGPAR
jgi:hypothetical protein